MLQGRSIQLVQLLGVLAVWELILETEVIINGIPVTFLLLLQHTLLCQLIFRLEIQVVELLAKLGVRIVLQGVLTGNYTSLIVAAAFGTGYLKINPIRMICYCAIAGLLLFY